MSRFWRALENLHDVSFDAAPLLSIGAYHDPVSVHHAAHFAAIEVKILHTLIVGNEKTEAVRVGMDPSSHQVLCVRQRVVIFLQANDSAFACEFPQGVDNPLKFGAPKSRALLYFDGRQSRSRFFGEEIQNSLLRPFWSQSRGWSVNRHESAKKLLACCRWVSTGAMELRRLRRQLCHEPVIAHVLRAWDFHDRHVAADRVQNAPCRV